MKILMVCLGNICRSPLAEGILRSKVKKYSLEWYVDSAGTSNWHAGEAIDERALTIAKKYGIDLAYKRSRQFTPEDFERFDRIYAMDRNNYRDVLYTAFSEEAKSKVQLLLNESYPGSNKEVPDPFWDDGFEEVFRLLDEACEAIVKKYARVPGF